MSSREFTEWLAYDRLAPFGVERSDINAAIIAMTVARVMGGNNLLGIEDFLPRFNAPEDTEERMLRIAVRMHKALGGRVRGERALALMDD